MDADAKRGRVLLEESDELTAQLEASLEEKGVHLCAGRCGTRVSEKDERCINCFRGSAA